MKTPVEDFLNSIYAVTLPMLLLILAFAIKLSALFYTVFEIPVPELKLSASILLAIAVSLTLLTVSVNSGLFETNVFPILFAICSGVMMLFVFRVISEDALHWSEYVKRSFLSVFLATIEYVYSKLFVMKYKEKLRNDGINTEELTTSLHQTELRLEEVITRLHQSESKLEEAEEREAYAINHFYCRHCQEEFDTPNACKTHEGRCEKNLKSK